MQLLSGALAVLKILTKFSGKYLFLVSFFDEAAGLQSATLLRKTPAQVFFSESWEICENSFFAEHLRANVLYLN